MVVEEFHDQKIIYHLNIDEEVNNILMHLSSLKTIKTNRVIKGTTLVGAFYIFSLAFYSYLFHILFAWIFLLLSIGFAAIGLSVEKLQKALEMVNESKKQIERMDIFVETMRKMSSLDTRELVAEEITSKQVEIDVRAEMNVFRKKFGKLYELECSETEEKFSGDKEVILEVIENLLSNAFRYAKTKVEMEVFLTCSELQIRIKDDGVGFTIDKQKATELFYQQNVKDSLKHSGMGMYISRLYCEKHGGQLLIENEKQSGTVITAVFHRIA